MGLGWKKPMESVQGSDFDLDSGLGLGSGWTGLDVPGGVVEVEVEAVGGVVV